MRRLFAFSVGLLLCSGGCGEKGEVVVTVVMQDVDKLVKEFKENEVSADAKHKGQLVGVTGIVREIGKEKGAFSDLSFLDLGGRARVRCYFNKDKEAQFHGLKQEDNVKITGICRGIHVSFRERLGGETLDDKFKKAFGTFVFITIENCHIVPGTGSKP